MTASAQEVGYIALPESPKSATPRPAARGKASLAAVTANLIVAGLGAGILSLPWAMAGASVVPSVATIMVVMLLNGVTVMILIHAAERQQAFDLGCLLGHLPGRWGRTMQVICNLFTFASVYLCLVSYIVVIADSLEPILFFYLGMQCCSDGDYMRWMLRVPLLALGAVAVLPLCFLDQEHLAFSSTFGILVNIYLVSVPFSLLLSPEGGVSKDCCVLGTGSGTIAMFSTMMQCAIIQMCVLPMYEELDRRSPRRFFVAVVISFSFLAVLFALFSGAAYFAFGPEVKANVIRNFPGTTTGVIARLGLVVAVGASYPLIAMSVTAPVRHWEGAGYGGGRAFRMATVAIVIASAAGALFFNQLGTLNDINGALQVLCFIGLVPGSAGLFLLGRSSTTWRLAMGTLVAFSIVGTFLGLSVPSGKPEELAKHCSWFAGDGL